MRRLISPRLTIVSICACITLLVAIAVGQQKKQQDVSETTESVAISGAKILVPEEDFDFGFIPNNSRVSHEYQLLSVGNEPLRILRVKPG